MVQMTMPSDITQDQINKIHELGGYTNGSAIVAIPTVMDKIKSFLNEPVPNEPEEDDE